MQVEIIQVMNMKIMFSHYVKCSLCCHKSIIISVTLHDIIFQKAVTNLLH